MKTKRDVIDYCLALSGAYEDYPFRDETAVLRHKGNSKSFAILINAHGKLHINLKCEPDHAELLRRAYNDVIPAYHMNKEHWNSVFLGGDVPAYEIENMIAMSYELTRPKIRVKKIREATDES